MKSSVIFLLSLFVSLQIFSQDYVSENPLEPNKFETPRETYSVFLKAMNDYKKGMESKNSQLIAELDTAVRCLNLDGIPYGLRIEKGRNTAILLKEVIDRVAILDPMSIPEVSDKPELPLTRWVLEKTEIVISKVEGGERVNEFLFSRDTVSRIMEFYLKTKHLPYLSESGGGAGYRDPWTEHLPGWAKLKLSSLYIWQAIGFLLSIALGFIVKWFAKFFTHFVNGILNRVPEGKINWKEKILSFCDKPLSYIVTIGFWYFCLDFLDIEGGTYKVTIIILQGLLSFNIIRLFYDLTKAMTEYIEVIAKERKNDFMIDSQIVPLISRTARAMVVLLGSLFALQNLGLNVVSVLAGLGVGGLALALAAKDTAANLFGSIMIFLDRPFKIGDPVIISGIEGDIEEIGFRCTRIRTLNDSVVSIPNSEVANSKIENLGQRRMKRTNFSLGLNYDTPPQKIEAFLEGIKNILSKNEIIIQDKVQVIFKGFGDSNLEIMVNYFSGFTEWGEDLIVRQNIFLEIISLSKELKVDFAFPTQTLHVESLPGQTKGKPEYVDTSEHLKQIAKGFGRDGKFSQPTGYGIFTPPNREIKDSNIGLGI
ncbi:MAG: mechanosensitive ion channel family protein [Leptospiraceae bacterium]|nr:mechanosensitive ion channel family protein [Leptospiraceae bacterium]